MRVQLFDKCRQHSLFKYRSDVKLLNNFYFYNNLVVSADNPGNFQMNIDSFRAYNQYIIDTYG